MRKKYNVYMNVIFETPIAVGQIDPPYTFEFIAKILLTEENDMELIKFSCNTIIPCSKSSVRKTKGNCKYTYYVDFCKHFGFVNIWDTYMPDHKLKKMNILLKKEDNTLTEFLQ